jgi:protein O-mannosyl-transferase
MKTRKVPIKKAAAAPAPAAPSKMLPFAICLSLAAVTLLVYFQTFGYGFVHYDDDHYVYENPMIQAGISAKGLAWAFTAFYQANWHPLTWISYLLDYQLFGLNAGVEHAVNLIFHMGAMVFLFLALLEMTQKPWRCALVAGIFALHPIHVESVAWIAERKDVLSMFFQMVTLWLYARYAVKKTLNRYGLMALAFALSLLAKPMAVTLPFVLLLLDLWPLGRVDRKAWRLIGEKTPLFAMSAVSSVLTFLAQRSGGAVSSLGQVPFAERLANAAVAYVAYLGKAFWPVNLAVLYPLGKVSAGAVAAAVLVLGAVTGAAVLNFRLRPYFLVGWFWYLGTLVPVIGLVQVGRQSMADRYAYMPLVGLSIAVVWSVAEAVAPSPYLRQAAAALAGIALIAMPIFAYRQVGYWKDSESLFRHTLAVTGDNPVMETNLGVVLAEQGKADQAIALYRRTLAADPDNSDAHANLGRERLRAGEMTEAFTELSEALRLAPDSAAPHEDLGLVLAARGQFEESRKHLEESLRLRPGNAEVESDLCFVLQRQDHLDQAITACEAALRIKPDFADARFNLGNALAAEGKSDAAAAEFSRVLEVNPNYAAARAALGQLRPVGRGR